MEFQTIKTSIVAAALTVFTATAAQAEFNLEHPHVPGELIVKFKDSAGFAATSALRQLGATSEKTFSSTGAQVISFKGVSENVDLLKIARELDKNPNVEFVEANQIYTLDSFSRNDSSDKMVMPDDSRFTELFGLHNTGQSGGVNDADIDAPEAWRISTGSRNTRVAVIDTGIDHTHPDLVDNIWINPGEDGVDADGNDKRTNGIDDDGNGYVDDFRGWDFFNGDNDPMDGHSHGTHCAGTIGATGNNGTGVVGVNWEVSLIGLKIFSDQGRTSIDKIVPAIEYATAMGVHLSSNSWGGGGASDAIRGAIAQADEAGILFIAAAGNSRSNNDASPHYPSSYELDNIIAVASTDHRDARSGFSSYGATSVDIGAPGSDILSTVPNGYGKMSGTSMATPHVAGLAALIKSTYPDSSAAQIKARVLGGGDPISGLEGKVLTGARINALNSLENDSVPPNLASGLTVSGITTTQVTLNWVAAGDDGSDGFASFYEIRFSENQIDENNWSEAKRMKIARGIDGQEQLSAQLEMPINTRGFLVIRAMDNLGNEGGLSSNISFETVQLNVVYANQATSMDGMTADAPWALETIDGESYFSDSPGGNYENDINVSLTTGVITVPNGDVTLALTSRFDLERRYDFGHIEISTDGQSWRPVTKYTDKGEEKARLHSLNAFTNGATSFQLRFRVTTDRSAMRDGWQIKSIQLLAPAS